MSPTHTLCASALLQGCGSPSPEPAPSPVQATVEQVVGRGQVEVHVVARGYEDPLATAAQEGCDDGPAGVVVLGEGGGLAGVAVWLDEEVGEPQQAELRVSNCRIEPHVLVVGGGSSLVITNDDPVEHEVEVVGDVDGEALTTLAQGGRQVLELPMDGMLTLRIGNQAWEQSTIILASHGAVTGADGHALLPPLSAGDHDVLMLHPTLGRRDARVGVSAGERTKVDVVYHHR